MGQVVVRNLDDETIAVLKARAAMHGNSLEQELRVILAQATKPGPKERLALADEIRAMTPGKRRGTPRRFDHPAYDCFYAALAESESAVLVTDDDKLIRLGKQARLGKWMKALSTFESRSK